MSEHRLPESVELLKGIHFIGEKLGYVANREFEVLNTSGKNKQASDVAYLKDKHQRCPIFLFEVESQDTNASSNNAIKIFGKKTAVLEKPLFFFHVVLSGSADSERIADLRGAFGNYNYKVYEPCETLRQRLLTDILRQHRRIADEVDLIALLDALDQPAWRDVDREKVFELLESLHFNERKDYVSHEYVLATIREPRIFPTMIKRLERLQKPGGEAGNYDYEGYIGSSYGGLIHLAILGSSNLSGREPNVYVQMIKDWQEKSCYLTQIGPHYGLDHDYDQFILTMAPSLWALIGAILNGVPTSRRYVCEQIKAIRDSVDTTESVWMLSAVWMLYLSASSNDCVDIYEETREFVNARGGIPKSIIDSPPFVVPDGNEYEEWLDREGVTREMIGELDEFKKNKDWSTECNLAINIALTILVNEQAMLEVGPDLARCLFNPEQDMGAAKGISTFNLAE